jgi:hypothetical protein
MEVRRLFFKLGTLFRCLKFNIVSEGSQKKKMLQLSPGLDIKVVENGILTRSSLFFIIVHYVHNGKKLKCQEVEPGSC